MFRIQNAPRRYCGRNFSAEELTAIRNIIADNPVVNRAQLSRLVCDTLNWRRQNGHLKDMSCRVAMLRMQDDGLIQLPPPLHSNNNGKPYRRRTQQAEPDTLLLHAINLELDLVTTGSRSLLWNE